MRQIKMLAALPVLLTVMIAAGCPAPTMKLSVAPAAINFGTSSTEETFTILNSGGSLLQWNVGITYVDSTYAFPVQVDPWLSADVTQGETLTETDRVTLTADRTGLSSGLYHALVTVASVDGLQSQQVRVAMRVQGNASIAVDVQALTFVCPTDPQTFTVSNTGEGPLSWTAYLADVDTGVQIALPSYISISPQSGSVSANGQTTVTVTVDCDELEASTEEYTLMIASSAGTADISLFIGGQGTGPSIGTDPPVLDFGQLLNELTFDVYNTGPTGSLLNFSLSTDRPELVFMDPTSGTSVGRISDVSDTTVVIEELDRKTISVFIDRAQLTKTVESAKIFISAPGVETATVQVRIEAAPLTVEGAVNRARPPYVQKFIFLLRDSFNQAVPTQTTADRAKLRFYVSEDDIPLDIDETNMFVEGPEKLTYNIVLLLDFTGSMQNGGDGGGAIISQMLQGAKAFVNAKPESVRLAIMEVHDRQQPTRMISNFDTSSANLTAALDAFQPPVGLRGASDIYDAATEACERLIAEDDGLLPFDDADIRAVVMVSDGRDTSSVEELSDLIDFAEEEDTRVRIYPVGFGENVDAGSLVELATKTGGHYYSAPTLARLTSLLGTSTAEGQLWNDFKNQIVLTYATLFQIDDHTYSVRVEYDQTPETTLQGYFKHDGIYWGGDVDAGQISLTTTGIANDRAEVFVRADYVPRNLTRLRFRIFLDPSRNLPPSVRTVLLNTSYSIELASDGPLVHPTTQALTWRIAEETEAVLPGNDNRVVTVLTDLDNYLDYARFGNLLKLTFDDLLPFEVAAVMAGVEPVFEIGIRVDNRIYYNPPTEIYFHYPGGIQNPKGVLSVGVGGSDIAPPSRTAEGLATILDPDQPNIWNQDLATGEGGFDDFDDRVPDDPAFH